MPDQSDPIIETIGLLSSKAAAYLRSVSYGHARLVVQEISLMIKYWEASSVALDPIEREVVLDSIVYGLSSVVVSFERAVHDVAGSLQRRYAPGQVSSELHDQQGT